MTEEEDNEEKAILLSVELLKQKSKKVAILLSLNSYILFQVMRRPL